MEFYERNCREFSIPLWVAPLLHAASRCKSDRARRRRTYKLIQHKLLHCKLGCSTDEKFRPTYVYPLALKQLVRTVFPKEVCNYPDPNHAKVVTVTLEDLNAVWTGPQTKPSTGAGLNENFTRFTGATPTRDDPA
ncbi:hypothetical protein ANANG_G00069880 [Anguilla anguilla]|uniref:Uncharacterized protein n=1 Tax=Anguilla anguilla TaxID=7936 RepID=A0A9D3S5Z0_ANGAN|nr:hypothetical protein ANANG_G00069880 [Anguilla anguilla]